MIQVNIKAKKQKQRRKKAVGFQYPPITAMKQVPRATSAEKKDLFFAEGEIGYSVNDDTDDSVSDSDHEEEIKDSLLNVKPYILKEHISPRSKSPLKQNNIDKDNTIHQQIGTQNQHCFALN